MPWTVYLHILKADGRGYVGLTSQTIEKRWKNHVCVANTSKGGRWHFPNAIRKYGKDAFDHMKLGVFDTLEAGNAAEEKWIEILNTQDSVVGFNLAKGGAHMPHPIRKNPWDDPEYRTKLSPTLDMRSVHTPEARAKCRSALESPEVKAKMSAASLAVWRRPGFREKISESIRSSPAARAATQALSETARIQRDSKIHYECKNHGPVPISDCYRKTKKDGRVHYSCKKCTDKVNSRYRKKNPRRDRGSH